MPDIDLSRLDRLNPEDRQRVETQLAKTLDRQLNAIDLPVRPQPQRSSFSAALTRLSTDVDYRTKAMEDPGLITGDYKLSLKELQALRQVAVLSGADVKVVDRIRVDSIARGVDSLASVDVSCCSCCCCCCGDTAVTVAG